MTLRLPDPPRSVSAGAREDAKAILSVAIFGRNPLQEAFDRIDPYCGEPGDTMELLSAMELFLRDLAVGAYEGRLVRDEGNRAIAVEMKKRRRFPAARFIALIEETRSDAERGVNRKNCMRGMALRFRQEAMNG
jgi:hypothetical protein